MPSIFWLDDVVVKLVVAGFERDEHVVGCDEVELVAEAVRA